MAGPSDDETPAETVDRRFPKAGEISAGDVTNPAGNAARLRYYAAEESAENPKRRKAAVPTAKPMTRLATMNP